MLEFTQTRDDIKTEITVEYLVDCESLSGPQKLYLSMWLVYLWYFIVLALYDIAKFRNGV